MDSTRKPWRARISLIVLFAVFFIPIFGSMALIILKPGWTPFGTINRGELIDPARALDLTAARTIDDNQIDSVSNSGHWLFVYVAKGDCEDACRDALTVLRQARLALGKDADRIERIWLVTKEHAEVSIRTVLAEFPGLQVLVAPPELVQEFPTPLSDAVFVVDPAGYLVLRYRGETRASDLHKDMKRLLKVSKQG